MKIIRNRFIEVCQTIRSQSPLVHCITNYVAMNPSANALLAIGASPFMSFCKEEMDEVVALCNALCVNIGCLDLQQLESMKAAVAAADKYGKPWVLDPVGAGATRLRSSACLELLKINKPAVIRGNASEIISLSGRQARQHGIDSLESSNNALVAAMVLAKSWETVVSVSGPIDFITDGEDVISISNGNPIMGRITATGCVSSALTAAFMAVEKDRLQAVAMAMALIGVAGEIASKKSDGNGTFQCAFIDELSNFDPIHYLSKIKDYE